MCGGYSNVNGPTNKCYTLNPNEDDPIWRLTTPLPVSMVQHSAVAIGKHIWFVHSASLYDYDTDTGTTVVYSMPFTNAKWHCAVANDTHSHVVAVGSNMDEVWVNLEAEDPSQWIRVATLPIYISTGTCTLILNTIHI